jgi:hypothetical protein
MLVNMGERPGRVESALRWIDAVRGVGFLIVLVAAGIAYVVLGHTAGRVIGVALLFGAALFAQRLWRHVRR